MQFLNVRTNKRDEFLNITGEIQGVVDRSGISDGACLVYVPHTTAGVTINENADPDVTRDMLFIFDKMIPWQDDHYKHLEGNSAAHVKASLVGSSCTVPVEKGQLMLGRWQGIYFCEFDGPRSRSVYVQILENKE